jgi:hypothetical protein
MSSVNELEGDGEERTCFVISPISTRFNQYYDEILEPAVTNAGLTPIKGDRIGKPGLIGAQIWRGISSAAVCIADLTGTNDNVMYEVGLAHALNKPVVMITQNLDDLPFDIQSLRFILYDISSPGWPAKLMEDITGALREALRNPLCTCPFEVADDSVPVQCRGTLRERYFYSDGGLREIPEGAADREYSPLEDVRLRITPLNAQISFTTTIRRPGASDNPCRLTGTGPVLRGAAHLAYVFQSVNPDVVWQSMGVMVLRYQHAIKVRGMWMAANIDGGDYLVGSIDLERGGRG